MVLVLVILLASVSGYFCGPDSDSSLDTSGDITENVEENAQNVIEEIFEDFQEDFDDDFYYFYDYDTLVKMEKMLEENNKTKEHQDLDLLLPHIDFEFDDDDEDEEEENSILNFIHQPSYDDDEDEEEENSTLNFYHQPSYDDDTELEEDLDNYGKFLIIFIHDKNTAQVTEEVEHVDNDEDGDPDADLFMGLIIAGTYLILLAAFIWKFSKSIKDKTVQRNHQTIDV